MMKNKYDAFQLLSVLLMILFIGLKLSGYIDWSWWWILFPVWLPIVTGMFLFLFLLILKKLIK